jgi:hypothetical protein
VVSHCPVVITAGEKAPLVIRGANEVEGGQHAGTALPPLSTPCKGIPLTIGGIKEVKLGAACGYHTAPSSGLGERKPPHHWGVK